jgi:peptide alpha-N-acetyltransferase
MSEPSAAQPTQPYSLSNLPAKPPDSVDTSLGRVFYDHFKHDAALAKIMALVEGDLSEPYSVFTYRYFIVGWPQLTILAHSDAGDIIGVIVCKADRANRRQRLRGYIAMLAVSKDWRKLGIGSSLAQRAIIAMMHMNCDEVVLETERSNAAALGLYERLGFTRSKRLVRYYLNGGDAFRLKLWFTPPSWGSFALVACVLTLARISSPRREFLRRRSCARAPRCSAP